MGRKRDADREREMGRQTEKATEEALSGNDRSFCRHAKKKKTTGEALNASRDFVPFLSCGGGSTCCVRQSVLTLTRLAEFLHK